MGRRMKLCGIGTFFVILFTIFAISFALDYSIIDYEEKINGREWLRSEQELRWLYEEWIIEHDKSYSNIGEKEKRFEIFKDNMRFIDEHNHPKNNYTYTVGLNQFADLNDEEFQSLYLSTPINISMELSPPVTKRYQVKKGEMLPYSIDWRMSGAVSRVKNQGKCESCRAFSTVAAVEGLYKIISGDLITLSEQELVDCDRLNNGCKPGDIVYSYEYIINNGGIDTDSNYPYEGVAGMCKQDRNQVVSISSVEILPSHDELVLQKAVANQPISVIIEAHSQDFRFHKTGVFTGRCGEKIDHFVTVIGYGTDDNGIDYWLIKNSWGPDWGEGGFGKIQRNVGGSGRCGILVQSVYPVMRRWPQSNVAHEERSSA